MSTASEDSSSDQPQRTSHQPGPLAILAATAMGGVLATRLGKAPLIFAACAAALALLRQKKTAAPPRAEPQDIPPPEPSLEIPEQSAPPLESPEQSLPPPAPPPEISAQSQVEQWLSRQISREAQAPVVDFSTLTVTQQERDDDYRPGSFLLDEFDDTASAAPFDNDSYASLTEPASEALWVPEPLIAEDEPTFAAAEPMNAAEEEELETPPAAPAVADAAWTLGVDPMPSLSDPAPHAPPADSMIFNPSAAQEDVSSPQEAPRSNMFSSAPAQYEEAEPPPFFSTSVFQGAALPDEIQVAPPVEPVAVMPAPPPPPAEMVPAWEPEPPVIESPPAALAAPEIPLELAADGDASFDPPLAAAPANPWQLAPDGFPMTPAVPFQVQTTGAVVEAEIILRPRAPMQNAVPPKSKFATSNFSNPFSDESHNTPPAHFPGAPLSPREPKPRTTWRSWWRGD